MKDLFTADDARKLSSLNDYEELLKTILDEIKENAFEGKREYITRSHGFGDGVLYGPEKDYPPKIKNVLKSLRQLGFFAVIETKDDSISNFTDIYLIVCW